MADARGAPVLTAQRTATVLCGDFRFTDAAQATFDQALRRDQSAARVLAGRGQVRTELGDYRRGLADLDRALAAGVTAEDEIDVRSARALALAGLGRFAEARTEIDAAGERAPGRARTALRAVWIAVLEGRFAEVADDLGRLSGLEEVAASPVARSARRLLARHGEAHPRADGPESRRPWCGRRTGQSVR